MTKNPVRDDMSVENSTVAIKKSRRDDMSVSEKDKAISSCTDMSSLRDFCLMGHVFYRHIIPAGFLLLVFFALILLI